MSGGYEMPQNLQEQEPGRDSILASAAGTRNIAQGKGHAKRTCLYHINPERGEAFIVEANGRDAWALEKLSEAGSKGCTPIEQPASGCSACVFNLRGLGVPIETLHELHGGEFSGMHGRYVLRALVTKLGGSD
jgi:hypothetical protein